MSNNWNSKNLNNPYFGLQHGSQNEIILEESILDEFVYNLGHTILYLPRTWINKDEIFGEDRLSEFNKAIQIPAFWQNAENWQGNQYNISSLGFGMEFDIQFQFYITRNHWEKYLMIEDIEELKAPAPGDIIIFNPYPNVNNDKREPYYLQVKSINTLPINNMSIQYGWNCFCTTLDYTHNDINIEIEDASNLEKFFSNDIEIREDDIGTDKTGFGDNNDFVTEASDYVIDKNNKFKKKYIKKG